MWCLNPLLYPRMRYDVEPAAHAKKIATGDAESACIPASQRIAAKSRSVKPVVKGSFPPVSDVTGTEMYPPPRIHSIGISMRAGGLKFIGIVDGAGR